MAGKRAYHLEVQKKGSSRRKLRASGLEWFVIDSLSSPNPGTPQPASPQPASPQPERLARGHRKKQRARKRKPI